MLNMIPGVAEDNKNSNSFKEEVKENSAVISIRPHLFSSTGSCSIPEPLKMEKGEIEEIDTRATECCNLLVVGGCFSQLCRLECKNASCKGIITKPEKTTEGYHSPC